MHEGMTRAALFGDITILFSCIARPVSTPKPAFPLFNPAGAQSPVGVDQSVFAPS
jgi:hypothetical protein